MGKYFVCFLLSALCFASGCTKEEATAPSAMPAPLVKAMTVEAKDTPFSLSYVGQTVGSRAVEVRAQVSGILTSRTYEEGEFVEKGQLLFTIEPDTYKANLAQAEGVQAQTRAKLTQAKQDVDRIRPLYAKNAVSQRDRDQAVAAYNAAQADFESAKAAVDDAKIKLGHAYVTAPVSGFTSKEYRSIGNLVSTASEHPLTVINQIDPIYATFSVPSPQYMAMRVMHDDGRLRLNQQQAWIELADGSPYPVPGTINFIDKQVNPSTSVVAARSTFPNTHHIVLPGQFVRVTISGQVLVNAIMIPQQAVLQTQHGTMVIVVKNQNGKDIAEMRKVDLNNQSYGAMFLVNSGLESGERIVIEGTNKVRPGAPVRFAQPKKEQQSEKKENA